MIEYVPNRSFSEEISTTVSACDESDQMVEVKFAATVFWRISNPYHFTTQSVGTVREWIRSRVGEIIRELASSHNASLLMRMSESMSRSILDSLSNLSKEWGIQVTRVTVKNVSPESKEVVESLYSPLVAKMKVKSGNIVVAGMVTQIQELVEKGKLSPQEAATMIQIINRWAEKNINVLEFPLGMANNPANPTGIASIMAMLGLGEHGHHGGGGHGGGHHG